MVRAGLALLLAMAASPLVGARAASTLNVPSNAYPSIQSAITAAANGDTIVVAPGTYYEHLDFLGKAVTLESSGGPGVTTIDGSSSGTVVTFAHGEGAGSELKGFTITHGSACAGAGIEVYFASPVIEGDVVTNNQANACSDGQGGGVNLQGAGSAQLIGNTISSNGAWWGGGVALFAAGTPLLENNVITGNSAASQGGGYYAVNQSDARVLQNLITANSSPTGAGVYYLTPSGTAGPTFTNDTIAANNGTGVYATGFDAQSRFFNTIISAPSGDSAVVCDPTYQGQVPGFDHSDASPAFGSGCTLLGGDITADPALDSTFHLTATSPAIDTGNNAAPLLPATDLDGKPRVINGTVDMGVYESGTPAPIASLSPATVNYGSVLGGSTATAQLTLSNTGSAAMTVSADSVSGSNYFSRAADTCLGQTVNAGSGCTLTVSFYAGAPGTFTGTLSVTDTAGTQTASLSATGSMGRPSFSPASLSFGSVKVGKGGGTQTITVKNVGNVVLRVFTVSLQGANPGDFKLISTSCSNAALAVGGSCTISVQFKPTAVGTRTAVVNFPCDDAVRAYTVPLAGTGVRG